MTLEQRIADADTADTLAAAILAGLDDAEFRQAVKHGVWKDSRWTPFLADDIVDRTQATMRELIGTLAVQRTGSRVEEDPEWAKSVRLLLTRLQARMGGVNARVKELNRQESIRSQARERKWLVLSFALAEALEASSAEAMLDATLMPDGDITVREWMAARRFQRSMRGDAISGRTTS